MDRCFCAISHTKIFRSATQIGRSLLGSLYIGSYESKAIPTISPCQNKTTMNEDDMVASLMAQMGEAQGYKPSDGPKSSTSRRRDGGGNSSKGLKRSRQLPELSGYPDNNRFMGSSSIWNPFVKADVLPKSHFLPVMPTNPEVEVFRRRAYEKFKQSFYEMMERTQQSLKLKLQIPALLEKWQFDCKTREFFMMQKQSQSRTQGDDGKKDLSRHVKGRTIVDTVEVRRLMLLGQSEGSHEHWMDPMLLSKLASSSFKAAFLMEFRRAWKDQKKGCDEEDLKNALSSAKLNKKLKGLQKGIYRFICESLDAFEKDVAQAASRQAVHSQSTRKVPKLHRDDEKNLMKVSHLGLSFSIHLAHYEKIQRMFDRAQSSKSTSGESYVSFEESLFCMLCRYDMLQGAGLQASLPGGVMDVLIEYLDCRFECFASPLNCRYQNFCSAFDLDRNFGSRGSFFTCDFQDGGCFQANPPFSDGLIHAMGDKINGVMKATGNPLMFVVFVPVWADSPGYQALLELECLSEHQVFKAGKHWYAEGTQHRRKESFRVASFDTSVFFYQNSAAKKRWPISEQFVAALKAAFAEDPKHSSPRRSSKEFKSKRSESVEHDGGSHAKRTNDIVIETSAGSSMTAEVNAKNDYPPKKKRKQQSTSKQKPLVKDEEKAQQDLLMSLGLGPEESEGLGENRKSGNKAVDFGKGSKNKRRKKKRGKP